MDAVIHLAPTVGIVAACDFLGVARASFYRQRPVLGPTASPVPEPVLPAARPAPARALSAAERASVLTVFPCGAMGSERTRCPVASTMAFPTAGAIPMMGHSPAPVDVKSLRSSSTLSIGGMSAKRGTR